MRVIIVDDHEVVREGLLAVLSAEEHLTVVGGVGTGAEALSLAASASPDLALIDLRLPDMSGEQLSRELTKLLPDLAIIVVSTFLTEEAVRSALQSGAVGYVTKASGIQTLRKVIDDVRRGVRADPSMAARITKDLNGLVAQREGGLRSTPQQTRVLELAAQGLTNKQVGAKLFISESTVRFHIQKLKELTESRTRTELIAKAIRAGMIAPHNEESFQKG